MQSKHAQAFSTYTWLIGLATDPSQSQQLRDTQTLLYLARAFIMFMESGRYLALPVEQLLRVVADGLDWLERVGQSNWAVGLRAQRGLLLQDQQRWQEARQELEAAVALSRRHPEAPGAYLANHLLQLADLLWEEQVGAYAEAIPLTQEVLATANSSNYDRWWAYRTLAYAHLGLHEYEVALQAAQQSLTLAYSIESSATSAEAYQVLGKTYRAIGRLNEAASAAIQQWRWVRKNKRVDLFKDMLTDCAQVRLLQVREACGLPLESKTLPDALPETANWKLAQRRLAGARRFVQWARPFASQLDQSRGSQSSQDNLDKLARQVEQLVTLLEREAAP
jgi:tetratricopeptide (TPR) repeat protein